MVQQRRVVTGVEPGMRRHAEDEHASGPQDPMDFGSGPRIVGDVLQHIGRHHDIEAFSREGNSVPPPWQ